MLHASQDRLKPDKPHQVPLHKPKPLSTQEEEKKATKNVQGEVYFKLIRQLGLHCYGKNWGFIVIEVFLIYFTDLLRFFSIAYSPIYMECVREEE